MLIGAGYAAPSGNGYENATGRAASISAYVYRRILALLVSLVLMVLCLTLQQAVFLLYACRTCGTLFVFLMNELAP